MGEARAGEVAISQASHAFPRPAATAAATEHLKPEASHFANKTVQAPRVTRHGMIVQPALHHSLEPAACFADCNVARTRLATECRWIVKRP